MPARLRLLIAGRVQGVGFRWFACDAAARAGCTGTVRNLPDGRVEVVAEGEPAALAALEAACRRGPRGGRVDAVQDQRGEAAGEFPGFAVVH